MKRHKEKERDGEYWCEDIKGGRETLSEHTSQPNDYSPFVLLCFRVLLVPKVIRENE